MFLDVWTGFGTLCNKKFVSGCVNNFWFVSIGYSDGFSSVKDFINAIGTAIYLSTHAVYMASVFIEIIDAEIVILVAGNSALSGAKTNCLNRMSADKPAGHVNVMHVLLHNMVSGKTALVYPVANHPFHFTPACIFVAMPQIALVPVNIG